jgi:ribosomal protein L11 methyltransferase
MQSNSKNSEDELLGKDEASVIRDHVISAITTSPARMSPSTLDKRISERYHLNRNQIKTVIRDLVLSGELTYTYEFGHTFLEYSFDRAVRIARHVVLKPPGLRYPSKIDDVVVQIRSGASFGGGRHPTTRLAIKGIEYVLMGIRKIEKSSEGCVLDIGTGSGVLVITAVLCGVGRGLGIDIDPCARVEAVENVKINGLEDRIAISGKAAETIEQQFYLVMANLRYPSLVKMLACLTKLICKKGLLILSGVKQSELENLLEVYTQKQFKPVWTDSELGWTGLVLQWR